MYDLQSSEPQWLDFADAGVPGVRVQFGPIEKATVRKAHRLANAIASELVASGKAADDIETLEAIGEVYSEELIRRGVVAWEGIGEKQGGAVDVTPDRIEAFLRDARLFGAADALYVMPYLRQADEKNGSAPSPNGTSAAATVARPTAQTASRRGAKSAPTSSRNQKPSAAAKPGKS